MRVNGCGFEIWGWLFVGIVIRWCIDDDDVCYIKLMLVDNGR